MPLSPLRQLLGGRPSDCSPEQPLERSPSMMGRCSRVDAGEVGVAETSCTVPCSVRFGESATPPRLVVSLKRRELVRPDAAVGSFGRRRCGEASSRPYVPSTARCTRSFTPSLDPARPVERNESADLGGVAWSSVDVYRVAVRMQLPGSLSGTALAMAKRRWARELLEVQCRDQETPPTHGQIAIEISTAENRQ